MICIACGRERRFHQLATIREKCGRMQELDYGSFGVYSEDSMPDASTAEVFNNEKHFGITVQFSEQGFGFGELVFSVNKETGEAHFDYDDVSAERCARIIERLAGTTITLYHD